MRELIGTRIAAGEVAYSSVDAILYALSLGYGDDPLHARELHFVYEEQLATLPTLPLVLGWQGIWMPDPRFALDRTRMLHAEERLDLHRPLPPAGIVRFEVHLDAVVDRGAARGAFIHARKELYSENDGLHLATVRSCVLARGDGDCGSGGTAPDALAPTPAREPDGSGDRPTLERQALLYRLNGDRNPLHADPELAKRVGFPVPILHGLCTYGTACRTILREVAKYDHTRIRGFDVRFSSPVYPGETVLTDMWVDANIVSFRCRLKERDVTVINNGKCTLAA